MRQPTFPVFASQVSMPNFYLTSMKILPATTLFATHHVKVKRLLPDHLKDLLPVRRVADPKPHPYSSLSHPKSIVRPVWIEIGNQRV